MKLNTTDFRRKCQHPLLLALGSVPLGLLVMQSCAPEVLHRFWAFPVAYVLLAWGCILIPGRKRLLVGVAGAALMVILGAALLPVAQQFLLAAIPAVYVGLLLVALPIGGWPRNRELAVGWHVGGVASHVVGQVMVNISRMNGSMTFEPIAPVLIIAFLLYAVVVLMALNRSSLDSAAMSRRTVPLLMRRQNLVITIALLLIGTLIAAIPAIGSVLDRLWDLFIRGVAYVAGLIMSLLPQQSGGTGGAATPDATSIGLGETQDPSLLALIMEKVLLVVAVVVLAIALFFAGRALLRKLIQLVKFLWGRLGEYSAAAGEDYEDEITDTRDEPDTEREGVFGRLRRMAQADEKGLSPTERVRSRYKRLKRKHTDWSRANTARETLPDAAASLYERARYSGQTLTEAEAERFWEDTRRV